MGATRCQNDLARCPSRVPKAASITTRIRRVAVPRLLLAQRPKPRTEQRKKMQETRQKKIHHRVRAACGTGLLTFAVFAFIWFDSALGAGMLSSHYPLTFGFNYAPTTTTFKHNGPSLCLVKTHSSTTATTFVHCHDWSCHVRDLKFSVVEGLRRAQVWDLGAKLGGATLIQLPLSMNE